MPLQRAPQTCKQTGTLWEHLWGCSCWLHVWVCINMRVILLYISTSRSAELRGMKRRENALGWEDEGESCEGEGSSEENLIMEKIKERGAGTQRGEGRGWEEMTVSGQDRRGGSRGERVIWIEWSRWWEEEEEEEKVQGDKSAEAPRVFRDKGLACRHQRQDYQRARKTYITPRKETFCFWSNARTKRSPKRRSKALKITTVINKGPGWLQL